MEPAGARALKSKKIREKFKSKTDQIPLLRSLSRFYIRSVRGVKIQHPKFNIQN
jgi:hypothetical protein